LIDTSRPLPLPPGAFLDLGDGDMIAHTASAATRQTMLNSIVNSIKASRNATPRWSGRGITMPGGEQSAQDGGGHGQRGQW
jgi:hypothetical protein